MVIKLSCWNVGKQSANLARLHTMCGSGAELSRAEISRARGSGRRYGGGAPIRVGALALLPIATADPCSWGRKAALPGGAKSSFFVGRLCKTCALSGYKILGSEPDWKARQSLKKFLASDSHNFPMLLKLLT